MGKALSKERANVLQEVKTHSIDYTRKVEEIDYLFQSKVNAAFEVFKVTEMAINAEMTRYIESTLQDLSSIEVK